MKNRILTLVSFLFLLLNLNAKSQNGGRFQLIQERIVQAKLNEIKLNLKLEQATFERFRPLYLMYHHEMSEIDFLKMGKLMKIEPDSLSTAEADQLIVSQVESAKKIIAIRESYYQKFRTVLSPQQIIKLYQTEAELRKKVMDEMKRRRLRN